MDDFADRPAESASSSAPRGAGSSGDSSDITGLVVVYTLMRIGLVVVICAVLTLLVGLPLIVALSLSIVIQLPLSMVVFTGHRHRITAAMAVRTEERRRLRDALRGDLS